MPGEQHVPRPTAHRHTLTTTFPRPIHMHSVDTEKNVSSCIYIILPSSAQRGKTSVHLPVCEMEVSELRIQGCTGEYGPEEMVHKAGRVRARRAPVLVLLTGALEVPGHYDAPLHVPPEQRHVHLSLSLEHGPRSLLRQPAPSPVVALHVRLYCLHSRVHHVGRHQRPCQLQPACTHSHLPASSIVVEAHAHARYGGQRSAFHKRDVRYA